jgi:SAM-dependent methyltransferase
MTSNTATQAQTVSRFTRESAPCALCGSRERAAIGAFQDRLAVDAAPFDLVRCSPCGHVYVDPRPADMGPFYPSGYWSAPGKPRGIAVLEQAYREGLIRRELRRVQRLARAGSKLLDVGCGTGDFLDIARRAGFQVTGVEFAGPAAEYARDQRGLEVRLGTLGEADLPSGSFDVVTLWHVLEHVPDPVTTLREAHRLLTPGGLLVVQVPNFGSLQAQTFKNRWYGLDVPRHLHHFTPGSLGEALRRGGFALAHPIDHQSFRYNPVILVSSLFPSLEPHTFAKRALEGRSQAFAKAFYLGMTWLAAPWAAFEGFLGRGAVITAAGRRQEN